MNQKVFAFFISALIASSALTYCVYKFTVQIKLMELQKQCTKEVLTKIEHRDSQFDDKLASMSETIKGFEKDGKALKQFIKILENGFEH
jgi:archaellum component FlaC